MARLVLKTFKAWNSNDLDAAWVNSYEFTSDLVIAQGNYQDMVDTIVTAEKSIHLPPVNFIQATISSWEEDSAVYNPFNFVTFPLTGNGMRATGGADPMADNVCYYMRRQVSSGRNGKLFYRGVLTEADVSASQTGRFQLQGGALGTGSPEYQAFMLNMQNYLGGGEGTKFWMFGRNEAGELFERAVLALIPAGVKINKRNHKYYDRKPKAGTGTPAAV